MLDLYHECVQRNVHGHVVSGVDWNSLIARRKDSRSESCGSSNSVDSGGDGIESKKIREKEEL